MALDGPDDGEVSLTFQAAPNGTPQTIAGWDSVKIACGIETFPRVFEIGMTERYPGEIAETSIAAGNTGVVKIGKDTVITGYADKVVPMIAGGAHAIKVVGRGRCEDLVDCTAEWPGGQIKNCNALQIATKLAQPYGIKVRSLSPVGGQVPQFNLVLTDKPYAIIEEVCRYSQLLAYEDADGALVLSQTGTVKAASGFAEGKNVQAASVVYSADQRFSEVDAFLRSMETLGDLGNPGNLIGRATDSLVTRHRRMAIIAEAAQGGKDIALKRAQWEVNRRIGRSVVVTVTVDSWRDSAGVLWTPNTLAPISLPSLKLPDVTWIIGQVIYQRDAQGTRAEIMLMDPKAFLPEPILLVPLVNLHEAPSHG